MPKRDDASDVKEQISRKLDVVISLLIRALTKNDSFASRKNKRGTGEVAIFLRGFGLSYEEIAAITEAPVASVRELVSRNKRSPKKKRSAKEE